MLGHRFKKILVVFCLSIVLAGGSLFLAPGVLAQTAEPALDVGLSAGAQTGLATSDIRLVVANIIRTVLGLLGIIALLIVLYGGFTYLTAGGNEEKVGTAKKILVNGGIGLLIILSSYAITSFVISRLVSATNNTLDGQNCTGPDCAGAGSGGAGGFSTSGTSFFVSSLPPAGDLCVRNVHPSVIFSKEVDLATLSGNITIAQQGGAAVAGTWQYGDKKSIVFFVPAGSCAPTPGDDCLLPKTAYTITFQNAAGIKSADGKLTLNCTVKGGCGPTTFTTGEGVDRLPPTLTIPEPLANSSYQAGTTLPVKVSFSDDNGLQNVAVYQGNEVVGSKSLTSCQKTGTVELSFATNGLTPGQYQLQALGTDWSGGKGNASVTVNLRPNHCFNNQLESDLGEKQSGPPACGGECGSCSGETCMTNADCGSGFCQLPAGGGAGACVQRTTITGLTPNAGAPGTYVTVAGKYFGGSVGKVYFAAVQNPSLSKETDWVEGKAVSCGAGFNSWSGSQAIVEVPATAVPGPVAVFGAGATLKNVATANTSLIDTSRDTWGPLVGDFTVNNEVRPSLCAINPATGKSGAAVGLIGKNFGLLNNTQNQVFFGATAAVTRPEDWVDSLIKTTVPNLEEGQVGVKIVRNGLESNSITFSVQQGASENAPFINSLSAAAGARGEYVTIGGRKFGSNIGAVWFKATPESEAIVGSFTFPEACQSVVWRDDQIVVKFPTDKGQIGTKYFVQIKTADGAVSLIDSASTFTLLAGSPNPGICKISPVSGPVPFAAGQVLTLTGEYFGAEPNVYFWKNGANGNDLGSRLVVEKKDLASATEGSITLSPPAGIQTGPVIIVRPGDTKQSNPLNFSVANCVQNNNTCLSPGYACCASGADAGACKPAGELCSAGTRSAGYVWRFSSAAIPIVPRVVERCNAQTDEGKNLPSPSPSVQWDQTVNGEHHNVCRTALATVELSAAIDQKTVTNQTVIVNKCSGVDDKNNCLNPTPVPLTTDSYGVKTAVTDGGGAAHTFLQLSSANRAWDDSTWYQVVLTKGIRSVGGAASSSSLALAADKPCQAANSAYCYVFKTDTKNCSLKAVVITPYSYWTKVLESPIKFRTNTGDATDLYYRGNGLSNQHCIMMDVGGFSWSWRTENSEYASVYGSSNAPVTQVSALANTVGIGLANPEDGVNVIAVASTSTASYQGTSPLTIDLSDPAVLDYWPRCLEACTNAEVGVRFNTTMSLRNLPGTIEGGTVQLLKCRDENCLSTESVLRLTDITLDPGSNYSVLKIANSLGNSTLLEPSTLYKVVISAASSAPNSATNQLWSAARINDPQTSSKPLNREFTWRFRTKKDQCQVDRAEVNPPQFFGQSITEKTLYTVQPYAAPDACSAQGQKINPWSVNWNWTTVDPKVAVVTSFSTKGSNPSCTASCIRKGSDVPANQSGLLPVCGNGKIEAGEDCDGPDSGKGCSLNCLFTGNTAATCGNGITETNLGEACDPKDPKTSAACSLSCRRLGSSATVKASDTNASICGNGSIGSGEDCDTGIAKSVANPLSQLNCSEKCLHTGAKLSRQWCIDNQLTRGGFSGTEFNAACGQSFSQCGDGVATPDEDPGCDVAGSGWNSSACNQFCLKKTDNECVPNTEGCDASGRHTGSSLLFSTPSSCGDAVVGSGEDAVCESSLTITREGLVDPWTLASGVGLGLPQGTPAAQTTLVKAATLQSNRNVSGSGVFSIACGYNTDLDCKRTFGNDYAVGENTCCYRKPRLLSTYPANNAATVCPNTYLEAVFDTKIDENTLKDNVLVARGSQTSCASGQQDVTTLIATTDSLIAKPWYRTIFARVYTTLKSLFTGSEASAIASNVKAWCVGQDQGVARIVPGAGPATTSRISISISAPLAFNTDYAVILKEGVKDIYGVSIGKNVSKNISWNFATTDKICEINKVTVTPPEWSFSAVNATTTLEASAFTSTNARVQPIPEFYDWQYLWGPLDNPYVSFQSTNTHLNIITANNRNGEIDVRAEARLTANKYTSASGAVATGSSHVIVYLCENPWPPKDLFVNAMGPFTIFPYQDKAGNNDGFDLSRNVFTNTAIPASTAVMDGYFNFGTYYCADSGSTGTLDDLPYLRPTVQASGSAVSPTGALKKFFFTNEKNADAIGVQVFANPKHLSPADWYALGKASGGQGFVGDTQTVEIDGYSAITDGNNIYVDALNYSGTTKNVYSTIYLFSINANAQPETRKVFDELLTNLKFNTNITNYGFCGASVDNPGFETRCTSDLDCSGNQICSASVDKLKRNYQRLRDLQSVQSLLKNYADKHDKKFPDMQEGSYLTGQTVSTWPSWSNLGNTLGQSVPTDPINQLATAGTCSVSTSKFCTVDKDCGGTEVCVLHDPITAWSVADRRFSFACPPASYAYRYTALPAGADYTVRAKFENTGLAIANQDMFFADFIDPKKFIIGDASGICNQDQEISTLNTGVCGDGVVNSVRGEQCDPVGQTRYGACGAVTADKITVDVCDASCKWKASDSVACSFLSKCGNGKVEAGEVCDDGSLNGRYNHCTTKCTLPTKDDVGLCGDGVVQTKNEVCDIRAMMDGKPGLCVGGVKNGQPCSVANDCNFTGAERTSFGGTCKLISETKLKYSLAKATSCNWDCQATGPYCGDGITQAEWGEECDGAVNACSINEQAGGRSCSASCKWSDQTAVAWWRFDDASLKDNKMAFSDNTGINNGSCDAGQNECPDFSSAGKYNGAFTFSEGDFITVPHYKALDVANITIGAWIKLTPGSQEGWKNILLKQNGRNAGDAEKDYVFSYYNTDKVLKLGFSSPGRLGKAEVVLPAAFAAGEWHHVAVTVLNTGSHIMKFYADGKPIADGNVSMSDAGTLGILADRNYPTYLEGGSAGVDELKVYNRVLQPGEIASEAQSPWFCSATLAPLALGDAPRCGDSRVDAGEACDKGSANGQSCSPAYGKSCSYCASDCKNIIDVQAKAYCGDGVVQGPPFGTEVCDMDSVTKSLYLLNNTPLTENSFDSVHRGYKLLSCSAQPQSDYTQKKEINPPACGTACSIPANNCVTCGVDMAKGVEISGAILNVLSPSASNPLLGIKKDNYVAARPSKIDVYIGLGTEAKKLVGRSHWTDVSTNSYFLREPSTDPVSSVTRTKLNSFPLCSTGDPRYTLRFNDDPIHRFDFPVFGSTAPEQYDLILSPVISNVARPNDIRVVVSWVKETPFYGGFTVPLAGKGKTEGTTFAGKLSSGANYFQAPRINGIGYHGYGLTGNKTSAEAFFVNTAATLVSGTVISSEMTNDQYAFYVRTDGSGISRFRNTAKLKVDVYFPENDAAENHFAVPAMTFYMNSASPSDNPNANYWHVFNIKRAAVPTPDTTASRIVPVNKIVSESKFF